MSYDFKKLSDVESVEEMGENDTVLIVQDGKVKQTSAVKGGSGDRVVLSDENVKLYLDTARGNFGIVTDELFAEMEEAWQKDPFYGVIVKGKEYDEESGDLINYWFKGTESYYDYANMASSLGHPLTCFVRCPLCGFFNVINRTTMYYDDNVFYILSESDFKILFPQ